MMSTDNEENSSSSDASGFLQRVFTQFTQFYDDSSDEDDVSDGLSRDIKIDVNQFKQKLGNDPIFINSREDILISFINSSFGLALYNARTVKSVYSEWKEKHLGKCIVPTKDIVTQLFNEVIKSTVTDRFEVGQHGTATRKLSDKYIEYLENSPCAGKLVNCLKLQLRPIMRWAAGNDAFPDEIYSCMNSLEAEVCDYLKKLDYSTIIALNDLDLPLEITPENLYQELIEHSENRYRSELAAINAMIKQKGLLTKAKECILVSQKAKKKIKEILDSSTHSPLQKDYLQKMLDLTQTKKLCDFETLFIKDLFINKMAELIEREHARGESSIIEGSYIRENADFNNSCFQEYEKYMKAFKPCTIEDFMRFVNKEILTEERSFKDEFKILLEDAIRKEFEPKVHRKSLPTMYLHEIKSSIEYIASLRLTKRSIYRTHRNLSSRENADSRSEEEHHDIGWTFPNIDSSYVAIERTTITAKACRSIVQIKTKANAYDKLGEKIEYFRTNVPCSTDVNVVKWIRQIINGDKLDSLSGENPPKLTHHLTLFLVQLAHLFIGTEGIRYPGALVQSQMIMDLIQDGKLTWKQAFTENEDHIYYPMILKGATKACRTLTTTFRQYSFYSHVYPGEALNIEHEKVVKYIGAERRLTQRWLENRSVSEEISMENSADILFRELNMAILQWYPQEHNDIWHSVCRMFFVLFLTIFSVSLLIKLLFIR